MFLNPLKTYEKSFLIKIRSSFSFNHFTLKYVFILTVFKFLTIFRPKINNLNTIVEELSKKTKRHYRQKENTSSQLAHNNMFDYSIQPTDSRKRNFPISFVSYSSNNMVYIKFVYIITKTKYTYYI